MKEITYIHLSKNNDIRENAAAATPAIPAVAANNVDGGEYDDDDGEKQEVDVTHISTCKGPTCYFV